MTNDIIRKYFSDDHNEIYNDSVALQTFLSKVEEKADKYFERGLTAVQESRSIRSYEDACSIIEKHHLKFGFEPILAESFACYFAERYRAGVEAAQLAVKIT